MTIACPSCGGRKQVMKLGMVMGQCGNCHGVGRVSKPEPIAEKLIPKPISEIFEEAKNDFQTKQCKEVVSHGKKKGK